MRLGCQRVSLVANGVDVEGREGGEEKLDGAAEAVADFDTPAILAMGERDFQGGFPRMQGWGYLREGELCETFGLEENGGAQAEDGPAAEEEEAVGPADGGEGKDG
jgi:hypothetical protein